MSKLWMKDNKLLVKDNRLLLADECCCESPFPCSFSKTVQGDVSTAMADMTGDIYDTCVDWWTDEETGETYCMYYDYTRSNLPGYARWCNYGDSQYPYNQFFGFTSLPTGGNSKTGRIACTISGNVSLENAALNTYYFYLQLSATASVVGATNSSENTWGASGTLSIATPTIPPTVEGSYSYTSLNTSPCGDDHGMVWINGNLRGVAWHGWFVPTCYEGDQCYDTCMEGYSEFESMNNQEIPESEILGMFSGFHLAMGSWDGACCGYCPRGGVTVYVQRNGLSEETARALCRAWTRANAIQIGVSDG